MKIKTLLVFGLFLAAFGLIYLTTDRFISLDDQFFHIRFAEMIREQGGQVFSQFPWLHFSHIAPDQQYFENYHFLFYLALLPFTYAVPLTLGIKLYGVVIAALSFALLYYFLRQVGARWPLFWTGLVFAATGSRLLLRFLNARPHTLAPILLLLLVFLLHRRKYRWALVLSVFYFFWHSATFFLPLAVAAVYFLMVKIIERRWLWRAVLYPAIGLAAAFLLMSALAPGFWTMFSQVTFSVIFRTILLGREAVIAGTELQPINYFTFLRPNALWLMLVLGAVVVELARLKHWWIEPVGEKTVLRLTLFALTVIFLIGVFFVSRYSDYLVFFAGAYLALAAEWLARQWRLIDRSWRRPLLAAALVVVVFLSIDNVVLARQNISQARPSELIAPAARWLAENTPAGSVVFNTSRDDFPTLFYYNRHNNYVVGMEARFLFDYSPRLYWLWQHASQDGYVCAEPVCPDLVTEQKDSVRPPLIRQTWVEKQGAAIARMLATDFGSPVILARPEAANLRIILANSPLFETAYADEFYYIYRLVDK